MTRASLLLPVKTISTQFCDKIKAVIPEGGSVISLTNNGGDPIVYGGLTYFQMGGTPLVNEDGSEVTMDKDIAVKAAEFVKEPL